VLSECSEECDARDFANGARRCLFKENVPRRSLFFLLASLAVLLSFAEALRSDRSEILTSLMKFFRKTLFSLAD
ncbi:conserved hypothetical protein, partial [Ricinus communis]